MNIRQPVAAGRFYPADSETIRAVLEAMRNGGSPARRTGNTGEKSLLGGVVPHAGYKYCAKEALCFFDLLRDMTVQPDTVVIAHPDHFGTGEAICADGHDAWRTPLGLIETDLDLASSLEIPLSLKAEGHEHAAEVLLPYLQLSIRQSFRLVVVSMQVQSYKNACTLAGKLARAIRSSGRNALVMASSDFTHYERPEVGFYYDNLVIDRIMQFNARDLFDTVRENRISVCGYGAIITLMLYAGLVSDRPEASVLARGNSGKCGDTEQVVDYVSIAMFG